MKNDLIDCCAFSINVVCKFWINKNKIRSLKKDHLKLEVFSWAKVCYVLEVFRFLLPEGLLLLNGQKLGLLGSI